MKLKPKQFPPLPSPRFPFSRYNDKQLLGWLETCELRFMQLEFAYNENVEKGNGLFLIDLYRDLNDCVNLKQELVSILADREYDTDWLGKKLELVRIDFHA